MGLDRVFCDGLSSLLPPCFTYFSALKIEAVYSSKALGCLQSSLRFNPEDGTVHSYHHENLISDMSNIFSFADSLRNPQNVKLPRSVDSALVNCVREEGSHYGDCWDAMPCNLPEVFRHI
jgi:hypothetical protein